MNRNRTFVKKSLAYAVMLTTPILPFAAKAMSAASQAYYNSAYGYCDAKKIAYVWNVGVDQAKAVIGNKVLANLQHLADGYIQRARGRVFCDYGDTELSYADAEKLGRYWGRPTHEAKQKATQMVSEMGNKRFREVMAAALTTQNAPLPPPQPQTPEHAYASSSYGFCDAKKVAHVWQRGVGEAKAIIGGKILANLQHLIDQDIQSTRGRVWCTYQETELSYADAEMLGRYWGRPTHEAKQKATQMISDVGTKRFRDLMADALRARL
jgi:hypothetical protein